GHARARGMLVENEREHAAGERLVLIDGAVRQALATRFARACLRDNPAQRVGIPIGDIDEVFDHYSPFCGEVRRLPPPPLWGGRRAGGEPGGGRYKRGFRPPPEILSLRFRISTSPPRGR